MSYISELSHEDVARLLNILSLGDRVNPEICFLLQGLR